MKFTKFKSNSYVRASWTKTFESSLPLSMRLLSGEMTTQLTSDSCLVLIWWTAVAWVSTLGTSQRDQSRMVLSILPETIKDPSVENSIVEILSVWPIRSRHWKNRDCCWQLAAKQFSLNNDETLRVKPREAAIVVIDAATALALAFDVLFFLDTTTLTLKNIKQKKIIGTKENKGDTSVY